MGDESPAYKGEVMAFYITKAGQRRAEARKFAKWKDEMDKWEREHPAPSRSETRAASTLRRLEMERDLGPKGRYVVYSSITKLPVDGFSDMNDAYEHLIHLPKGSYIWDKVGRRKL